MPYSSVGHDYLALESVPFNAEWAAKYAPGAPLGTLHNSFGNQRPKLIAYLNTAKPSYFRVHIINTVCIRNKNCGNYEIGHGYSVESFNRAVLNRDPKILGRYKEAIAYYRQIAQETGRVVLISPALEHDLSIDAYRVLQDEGASVWPDAMFVNNALSNLGERYNGAWRESHGFNANPDSDIVSLDGMDASDVDIRTWLSRFSNAKILYLWSRSYNCRHLGVWTDPRHRISCPKEYQFEELARMPNDRGLPPALEAGGCTASSSFTSPLIWKPFAEDKGTGDGRANKPVAIIKQKVSKIEAITHKGVVVGSLGYYGDFAGGMYRYYAALGTGENGYLLEQKAKALSGSPYVWLRAGNVCVGPIIAGMRQGDYR